MLIIRRAEWALASYQNRAEIQVTHVQVSSHVSVEAADNVGIVVEVRANIWRGYIRPGTRKWYTCTTKGQLGARARLAM